MSFAFVTLRLSLFPTYDRPFTLMSTNCPGLRPPAAQTDAGCPPAQAVSSARLCNAFGPYVSGKQLTGTVGLVPEVVLRKADDGKSMCMLWKTNEGPICIKCGKGILSNCFVNILLLLFFFFFSFLFSPPTIVKLLKLKITIVMDCRIMNKNQTGAY